MPTSNAGRTDAEHLDGQGILVATRDGWICPYCDYRQDWAHSMSTWIHLPPGLRGGRAAGGKALTAFGIPIILHPPMRATTRYANGLGKRIRSLREKREIGLRRLAAQAEISASYLSEIEHGVCVPSIDKVQRLAKALGVPIANLLPAA